MNRLLYRLTAGLPCRLIERNPGERYLERYYLGQLFGWTFYLHRFVSRDADVKVHNHPWSRGFSVVLSGAYTEEVATDICPYASPSGCVSFRRVVRWFNRIDGNRFHRIVWCEPGTWTLMAHGPRERVAGGRLKGWGFLHTTAGGGAVVYTPYGESQDPTWWVTAPKGRDAGRAANVEG